MNSKEYLSQAYKLDQRINSKLGQVAKLKERATCATATIHALRISGTCARYQMEDAVVKIIDLEREIDVDIDKLVDIKQGIIELINTAEKIEFRNLLKLRYLDYKSWFEISIIMNCRVSEVHILHLKALQSIRYNIVLV